MATIIAAGPHRTRAPRGFKSYALILVAVLAILPLAMLSPAIAGQFTTPLSQFGADLSPSRMADYSRDAARSPSRLGVVVADSASGQERVEVQQVEPTARLAPLKPAVMGR